MHTCTHIHKTTNTATTRRQVELASKRKLRAIQHAAEANASVLRAGLDRLRLELQEATFATAEERRRRTLAIAALEHERTSASRAVAALRAELDGARARVVAMAAALPPNPAAVRGAQPSTPTTNSGGSVVKPTPPGVESKGPPNPAGTLSDSSLRRSDLVGSSSSSATTTTRLSDSRYKLKVEQLSVAVGERDRMVLSLEREQLRDRRQLERLRIELAQLQEAGTAAAVGDAVWRRVERCFLLPEPTERATEPATAAVIGDGGGVGVGERGGVHDAWEEGPSRDNTVSSGGIDGIGGMAGETSLSTRFPHLLKK
jgi:hypothetical protein